MSVRVARVAVSLLLSATVFSQTGELTKELSGIVLYNNIAISPDGERDAECPAPQSYEFWHALRALGVVTQLVVYLGEGHMFLNPMRRLSRVSQVRSGGLNLIIPAQSPLLILLDNSSNLHYYVVVVWDCLIDFPE